MELSGSIGGNIDDLPDFILYDIFNLLTQPDLRNCSEVCQRWKQFIPVYFDIESTAEIAPAAENTKFEDTTNVRDGLLSATNLILQNISTISSKDAIDMYFDAKTNEFEPRIDYYYDAKSNRFTANFDSINIPVVNSDSAKGDKKGESFSCEKSISCIRFLDEEKKITFADFSSSSLDSKPMRESVDNLIFADDESLKDTDEEIVIREATDDQNWNRSSSILVQVDPSDVRYTQTLDTSTEPIAETQSSIETSNKEDIESPTTKAMKVNYEIDNAIQCLDDAIESSDTSNVIKPLDSNDDGIILNLDHAVLNKNSPFVKKLMWGNLEYDRINFGYVKIEDNEQGEELEGFWEHVGRSAIYADFSQARHAPFPIKVFNIVPHFQNLKTLEIDYTSQIRPLKSNSFSELKLPSNLTSLVLHRLMADNLVTYALLYNALPKSCHIYIRSALDVSQDEDNYLSLIKKGAKRIKGLSAELLTLLFNTYKGILVMQTLKLQLDQMEVDVAELETLNHLEMMVKLNPGVKWFKIKNSATFMPYTSLTHLHINFVQDVKSFKPLQKLHNLESFEFEFKIPRWKCFFGHEELELSSIRFLSATTDKLCLKCWVNLLKSCKLDKFCLISSKEALLTISPLLNEYQQQLKSLELYSIEDISDERAIDGITAIFNNLKQPFSSLKSLSLKNMVINSELMIQVAEKMKNLTELELDGKFTGCNEIFKIIISQMSTLKFLKVVKDDQHSDKLAKSEFIELGKGQESHLEHLELNAFSTVLNDVEMKQVYENHAKLRSITFTDGVKSRINYFSE